MSGQWAPPCRPGTPRGYSTTPATTLLRCPRPPARRARAQYTKHIRNGRPSSVEPLDNPVRSKRTAAVAAIVAFFVSAPLTLYVFGGDRTLSAVCCSVVIGVIVGILVARVQRE